MIVLMKGLNEEFNVKRCLSDFHDEPFCSKVIVIDGGSTDYTVQELQRFSKVKVYQHPWLDWYHNMEVCQSNIALSYVPENALCVILDFDERFSAPLKAFLNDLEGNPQMFGLGNVGLVARQTNEVHRYEDSPHAILGDDGWPMIKNQIGQWPDYQCRIIRKSYTLHWVNSPHHVMCGETKTLQLPPEYFLIHYEKDDLRLRERIEKKWLRMRLRREMLEIPPDIFETQIKPELIEFSTQDYWKEK